MKRTALTQSNVLTRAVTVPFGDEQLHATVRVTGLSEKTRVRFERLIQHDLPALEDLEHGEDMATAEAAIARVVKILVKCLQELVVEWDLEEEDGTVTPLTREGLEPIGPVLLMALVAGIAQAIQEGSRPLGRSRSSKRSTKQGGTLHLA